MLFEQMNPSVIVWDIETVPDLRGFAAAKGLAGKPNDEVSAEMGDKFPKLNRKELPDDQTINDELRNQGRQRGSARSNSCLGREQHSRYPAPVP